MSTRGNTTKKPAVRKMVGNKGKGKQSTRRTVSTAPKSEQEVSGIAQRLADGGEVTMIACNRGGFQLRVERTRMNPAGYTEKVPGIHLQFPGGRPIPGTPETIEIVEAILRGEHSDGEVDATHFQKLARAAGLRLIHPGLAVRPMKTWDDLDAADVVPTALKVGLLESEDEIRAAIRYEIQASKRGEGAKTREKVVRALEALLEDVVPQVVEDGDTAAADGGAVFGEAQL